MALKMKFVNTADPSDYVIFPIIRGHINNYDGTKHYFSTGTFNNRIKLYEKQKTIDTSHVKNIPDYETVKSGIVYRTYTYTKNSKFTLKLGFSTIGVNQSSFKNTGLEVVYAYITIQYNGSAFGNINCFKHLTPVDLMPYAAYSCQVTLCYDMENEVVFSINPYKFEIKGAPKQGSTKVDSSYLVGDYYFAPPEEYDTNADTYNGKPASSYKYDIFVDFEGVILKKVPQGIDGSAGTNTSLYYRLFTEVGFPNYPDGDDDDEFPDGDRDDDSDDIDPNPRFPISVAQTGFITMYSPTASQLKELASFMWSKSFLDVLLKLQQNPYDAIISIKNICCDIETGAGKHVILGNVDTQLSFPEITSQFQQIDCGSLNITRYFGNFLDFNPYTSIKIFLPFIGYRELDVDDVMNSTLHLYYNVDILTGSCVAILQVTKQIGNTYLNSVLYQFDGMIANEIPVTAADFSNVVSAIIRGAATTAAAIGITAASGGTGAVAGGALLGSATAGEMATATSTFMAVNSAIDTVTSKVNVQHGGSLSGSMGAIATKTPYIIITRVIDKNPSNYAKLHGVPSNAYKKLSSLKGFTKMQDIQIKSTIGSVDETEEIKQLLTGGVVI